MIAAQRAEILSQIRRRLFICASLVVRSPRLEERAYKKPQTENTAARTANVASRMI